ncbi:MAG TPA: xanthine dehydrogenase family protein subunit M [Bryobacteraceae bacterium]|jgi:xanthine dehydrogenase YagS FAD-binding subunit
MENFAYASPSSVKDATGMLSNKWGEVEVLAGGTDLISMMKEYLVSPRLVVNVKGIKDLHGISAGKNSVRIGAAVSLDEISENPIIAKSLPALHAAALGVSSPQIRNMGTIGGDLCQRPRCWYYRQGFGIFAKGPDGKSLVPNGENRFHAILGNSGPAQFVSASSFGPALVALGATIRLVSSTGSRDVEAEKFFVTPTADGAREIAMLPNEMITEIHVPVGTTNATYEVREKAALDWPLAAASVSLKMNGGTIQTARVVLGHVAPTPWVAQSAGKALEGKSLSAAVAEAAGKQATDGATPLSQNGYKVRLAQVAVKRALLAASGAA